MRQELAYDLYASTASSAVHPGGYYSMTQWSRSVSFPNVGIGTMFEQQANDVHGVRQHYR
jgi:hypothetical protein